jgi:hypothetical protein
MPFRYGFYIVSFPFEFHSAAVFDSHFMPRLCRSHAGLKATSQGHGTARHVNGMVCVN